MGKFRIRVAKIELYHALLEQLAADPDSATDNEIELGYRLSLDRDIQKIFERARKAETPDESR